MKASDLFINALENEGVEFVFGIPGSELLPLMQQCHDESGVHLIEVPVDDSENDRILNHEIHERSEEVGR